MNLAEIKKFAKLKPWVSQGDAAAILGLSRVRVWQLVHDGKLESIAFLGARHVLLSSIVARLEQRVKLSHRAASLLKQP